MIKKAARKADGLLFNSFVQRRFTWPATDAIANSVNSSRAVAAFEKDFKYHGVTLYDHRWNRLSALCDLYGSDKGQLRPDDHPYDWPAHTPASGVKSMFQSSI